MRRTDGRAGRRTERTRYALCVRNDGYAASLEVRKVYQAIRDRQAEARGLVRVIDESGQDYLYPAEFFVPVTLSKTARDALAHAG
jgi:hypothetical protein